MRQKLVLLLLIVFCIFCSLYSKEEKAIPTFNEIDYNYNIYNLDISRENITTKNMQNIFDSYTIISVEPYVNPIYSTLIATKTFDFDTNKSISVNVDILTNHYVDILKNNGLNSEAQTIEYNGIKIDKVSLYITNSQLDMILNNYKFKLIS